MSFVWSCIWEEKEALVRDYRLVLGDGCDVDIFTDP